MIFSSILLFGFGVEIFLAPGLFLPVAPWIGNDVGITCLGDGRHIWPNQEFDWSMDLFVNSLIELAQFIGMSVVLGYLVQIKIKGSKTLSEGQ